MSTYSSRLTPGDLLLTTCSFVLTTRCFAGGRGPTAGVTRRTAVTRPERNRERPFERRHDTPRRVLWASRAPRPASPLACARASTTTPILALLSLQAGWLCFAGWPCVCSPHPSHAPSNYGRLFFRQRRLFLQAIPLGERLRYTLASEMVVKYFIKYGFTVRHEPPSCLPAAVLDTGLRTPRPTLT